MLDIIESGSVGDEDNNDGIFKPFRLTLVQPEHQDSLLFDWTSCPEGLRGYWCFLLEL